MAADHSRPPENRSLSWAWRPTPHAIFPSTRLLKSTKRLGLTYISLKDMHLPLNGHRRRRSPRPSKSYAQAGITLYGGGVIYMKSADDVNRAFDYAKGRGTED